ncbi:MAG: hypothetical protein HQL22_07035 [Candidatus Omnitrophica bacterium]|nr:hypothetical protein [Candidatus Omnitrophota bacterium]
MIRILISFIIMLCCVLPTAFAQTAMPDDNYPIFDDKLLIEGYAGKLSSTSKDVVLAMINDDSLVPYRKAAAIRVYRTRFASQTVTRELSIVEKILLRQLERASSVYVQVELMHTLVILDRYRYFDAMVPALIQKMDHYDMAASEMAYTSIVHINDAGSQRAREARIEFNTLRKIFFLTRKKLEGADLTDIRLKAKLDLLRWSIKVLGTDELKNLPKEVISLM